MPLLANFLIGLFGSLIGYFAKRGVKKAVLTGVYVASFLTGGGILWAAITVAVNTITTVAPPQLTIMSTWVMPDNWRACVFAVVAAEVACALFGVKRQLEAVAAQAQ